MTYFDLIFVSASIGLIVGLLIRRQSDKLEIKELEVWNLTAIKALVESDEQIKVLQAELNEVKDAVCGPL